ncbi:hypothetical protein Hanom_Chr16g01490111 [Helianthus anomalus]
MFDLLLLQPIPFSVFLATIIRLHPKEEPDQTDNYVKHYCCIYIWILCWPVLMQSKVCFPSCINRTEPTCGIRAYVD